MLSKDELYKLIEATRQHVDLPARVIEKDYYVTQAIHALSNIENENFRLVFAGGTCLAKAHKVVNRMSEDIDFKIQIKNNEGISRSQLIKKLKEFREQIKLSLVFQDLTLSEHVARNEGKYQRSILQYASSFSSNAVLRPDILLEFTMSNIRLPTENLSIRTIIEDILKDVTLFSPSTTTCISINETALEKWVGLTRRIIAIERNYHADDAALVRHVYDLNAIQRSGKIDTSFFNLAKHIISNDANQFKNQHPEYWANPGDEIKQSLALLKTKPLWKERYGDFIENMVYEPHTAFQYETAIETIEQISAAIIDVLQYDMPYKENITLQ